MLREFLASCDRGDLHSCNDGATLRDSSQFRRRSRLRLCRKRHIDDAPCSAEQHKRLLDWRPGEVVTAFDSAIASSDPDVGGSRQVLHVLRLPAVKTTISNATVGSGPKRYPVW